MNLGDMQRLKEIRAFIASNPGLNKDQIYAATNHDRGLAELERRDMIFRKNRKVDGKPGWHIRPMTALPENFDEHHPYPHPDKALKYYE